EQRRALLRGPARVRGNAASHRAQPLAAGGAWKKRPAVFSRALRLAGDRTQVSRHASAARERAGGFDGAASRVARAPEGGLPCRQRSGRGAARRTVSAGRINGLELCGAPQRRGPDDKPGTPGAGRSDAGRGLMAARTPAVHQVLATLGYGDAIGHEVLAIQRVLRQAGYESDVFVETADRRLEPLTRDYRELVDASNPVNLLLHHFSIGSKASRTAYALPDRMALIYHNITPPEYFVGIHRTL